MFHCSLASGIFTAVLEFVLYQLREAESLDILKVKHCLSLLEALACQNPEVQKKYAKSIVASYGDFPPKI